MPGPFPGMDPYLEGRRIWPDVHNALIVAIRDALAPQVEPAYYIAIILVAAGWERPRARLYAFSVRQAIPDVPVPLRRDEKEAQLSLGALLGEVYDRARYALRLDYRREPEPPLAPEDAAWADDLLRAHGRRA